MSMHCLGIVLGGLAALALTACGSPGGDSGMTCNPGPQITSTPPTVATTGYQYTYYTKAAYLCGGLLPFTCSNIVGVQLPTGAAVDAYYSITWTPASDQANRDVQFVIATEPDTCGDRATQSWTVHVYPAPVIETFTAARTALNPGESTSITAVFQGSGSIEGLGPITSGIPIATPALNTSTNFTLSVINGFGTEVRQTLTVQVLQPPAIQSFTASPATITAGGTSTLTWRATGDFSVARVDPLGVDVMQGSSFVVTPVATTTYVLSLSNATGASASASVQVVVVAAPVIDSFNVTPTSSVLRGTVSLVGQFHSGTGEIVRDDGGTSTSLGPVVSGVATSSGELLRSSYFQLVVRNAAGTTATQNLFVPITGPGTFQLTSGQPISPLRSGHTATRLLDGRVFIAGGGASTASTEIFDPATETFVAGPSLLEGRTDHTAALLPDGRVLLVGGYRTNGTRILDAEIYDPGKGVVISAGPLPVTDLVLPQSTVLLDGRVLVVHTSLGQGSEVFEPLSNTFTPVGPLNVSHGCVSVERFADGRVLVIDGQGPASEIFSPGPDTFALTDAVTHGGRCYFSSATLLDGRVLVTGGSSLSLPAEVYDPTTGLFTDVGMQQYPARTWATASTLASGAVLVVGGAVIWSELFDPSTGTFAMTGGCNVSHRFHTATVLRDGRVLVFGGCSMVPCAEIYTPQ